MNDADDDTYLLPHEVSEELRIPEQTLANWRWRGIGPRFLKIGKHVRYRRSDLNEWLAGQTRGGDAA